MFDNIENENFILDEPNIEYYDDEISMSEESSDD